MSGKKWWPEGPETVVVLIAGNYRSMKNDELNKGPFETFYTIFGLPICLIAIGLGAMCWY